MALQVVEDLYRLDGNDYAVVVVEAPTRAELEHMDARKLAARWARDKKSFQTGGINNIPQPYAVDAEGNSGLDLVKKGSAPVAWRIEVRLAASNIGFF